MFKLTSRLEDYRYGIYIVVFDAFDLILKVGVIF